MKMVTAETNFKGFVWRRERRKKPIPSHSIFVLSTQKERKDIKDEAGNRMHLSKMRF
jgi:hypothetical protein